MPSPYVTELSDATFAPEIEQYPGTAVVDFWAAWCGPCRAVAPIVEDLAAKHAGRVKVAKLDVDAHPLTPNRYGIRSIPTLIFFREGRAVDVVVGVLPKAALDERIRSLTAAPSERAGFACC